MEENKESDKTSIELYSKFQWIIANFNNAVLEIENINNILRNSHSLNKHEVKIFSFNLFINLYAFDNKTRELEYMDMVKVIITTIVISLKYVCDDMNIVYSDICNYYRLRYKFNVREFVQTEGYILQFFNWRLTPMYTINDHTDEELLKISNQLNPLNVDWIIDIYNEKTS